MEVVEVVAVEEVGEDVVVVEVEEVVVVVVVLVAVMVMALLKIILFQMERRVEGSMRMSKIRCILFKKTNTFTVMIYFYISIFIILYNVI